MHADQFRCQARMGRIEKLQTRGLFRLGSCPTRAVCVWLGCRASEARASHLLSSRGGSFKDTRSRRG